jgi:hypothetical protein
MNEEALFEKWNKWLYTIYNDFLRISTIQHIYIELQEIIDKNSNIQVGNLFYWWMDNVYIDSVVMGIRRQLDTKKYISLIRLLKEVKDNTTVISRKRFVSLWDANRRDRGNRTFILIQK